MCDRMFCGCRDKQFQRTPLAQQELTFAKAFKMACARLSEQGRQGRPGPPHFHHRVLNFIVVLCRERLKFGLEWTERTNV